MHSMYVDHISLEFILFYFARSYKNAKFSYHSTNSQLRAHSWFYKTLDMLQWTNSCSSMQEFSLKGIFLNSSPIVPLSTVSSPKNLSSHSIKFKFTISSSIQRLYIIFCSFEDFCRHTEGNGYKDNNQQYMYWKYQIIFLHIMNIRDHLCPCWLQ